MTNLVPTRLHAAPKQEFFNEMSNIESIDHKIGHVVASSGQYIYPILIFWHTSGLRCMAQRSAFGLVLNQSPLPETLSGNVMKHTVKFLLPALALIAGAVQAPAFADQLADVKARGTVVCGVLGSFEPFGYTDTATRAVVGYDVDMCAAIAKHMGLKSEVKPVAIDARIPELQQGRMDILAAGLGYSVQRAEQVDFSSGYYISEHKLSVKADKGYASRNDLAGKRISFTKGGITEGFVKATVPDAVLVGFEDTPTAFTALAQGKVDAFSVSEVVARRLISKLGANASQLKVVEPSVGKETWGLGVKKGETGLLKAVNEALQAMETSGEAQQIFDKWLGAKTMYDMKRSFKIEPIKG
jgi:polar amino acid transport system substrate-binding protein